VRAQGDDYILYCHPSRQKTPRSDRLREWYLTLLRMAKAEGTVAHLSNLFDTFFEGGRDHRMERASITHMPYFEGARGGVR
jgi:E1A/CREB-binding protein